MFNYKSSIVCLILMSAIACEKSSSSFEGKKDNSAAGQNAQGANGNPAVSSVPADQPIIGTQVDGRPVEQVLCQDGFKLLGLIEKTSFNEDFSLACAPEMTTELFQELVSKAYAGSGEPNVKLVDFKIGDMFATKMVVAYAMKVPLDNPSEFYALKAHDSLTSGIQEKNSEVLAQVENRRNFPGRRSVEEILLNYSLTKSEGGGLYDKRRTKFNTYLLKETSTDVVVSTEELLDVDKNNTYHDYKGLLLGVKADQGSTYLVFINHFHIKNRIDPIRLQRTLLALSQGMQKKMYNFFVQAKGAAK